MPRDREGAWHEEPKKPRRPAPPSADMIANQRKYPRFEIDGSGATLILKGFLSLFGLGRSRATRGLMNLSEGGALVVADEPVARGKKVRICIDMEKYQDVFEADGIVRWCTRGRRNDKEFHLGIQFTKMPPAQARKLSKMREWFTSPAYLAKAKARANSSGNIEFPH